MSFSLSFIIYVLITLTYCYIEGANFVWEPFPGTWSQNMMQGQPDEPSQFFLCGIQFRQKRWTLVTYGRRNIWGKRKRRTFDYYHMTNAATAYWCSYLNWGLQKTNSMESHDKVNYGWRSPLICPQNFYVSGIAPRYSVLHHTYQGMSGMRLVCRSNTLNHEVFVDDGVGSLGSTYESPYGSFLSLMRFKYTDKLETIFVNAEPMPVVTMAKFSYQTLPDFNGSPEIVNSVSIVNLGSENINKKVRLVKELRNKNIWTHQKGYLQEYSISATASFDFGFRASATSTYTSSKSEKFVFGKEIETVNTLDQEINVVAPPCTQIVLNSVVRRMQINLPFSVQLTFSRIHDQNYLCKRTFNGTWRGVVSSNIEHKLQETAIPNCRADNLRKTKN